MIFPQKKQQKNFPSHSEKTYQKNKRQKWLKRKVDKLRNIYHAQQKLYYLLQSEMKQIIFCLGFLLILHVGQSCSTTSTSMSFYGCTLETENCEDGFIMHECKQRYCAAYHYTYDYEGRRQRECSRYAYHYYSENTCIDECCGDVGIGVNSFTAQFLTTCQEQNTRLTNLTIIIVCSVLGGVILLVAAYCWHKKRKGQL